MDWDRLEMMIRAAVGKQLRSLERRVNGAIAKAVLGSVASGGGTTTASATLRADDEDDEIEVCEAYGFTSAPLAGAEGVGLTVGGDNTLRLLVCLGDRRHRPKDLAAGEVAVYRNAAGHRIILKADGSTEITTPVEGQTIVLKASGDVVVTPGAGAKVYLGADGAVKKVALADDVDAALDSIKTTFNLHTHTGVTPGMGSSAVSAALIGVLALTGATKVNAE